MFFKGVEMDRCPVTDERHDGINDGVHPVRSRQYRPVECPGSIEGRVPGIASYNGHPVSGTVQPDILYSQ